MVNNLASLKKIAIGTKLKLVYRYGKTMDDIKEVGKVQSNAIAFKKGDGLSWLYLPPASLIEFTETGFKTYSIGTRELTEEEQNVYNNRPRDAKQEEIDALSDGNTMFYRERAYFEAKGMPYLTTYNKDKHLIWVGDKPMIKDPKVKGTLELEYIFC